jgi:hypothetical protein
MKRTIKLSQISILAVAAALIAGPAFADAPSAAPAVQACQAAGDELVLVDAGQRTVMRFANAQVRTAARGMGFGGVGQYAAFPGPNATMRLPANAQPTFLLQAPSNMQPQGLFTLARLERRRNGTREVSIGGGYMSYSTGVPADRQVAVNFEALADQRGAPAGMTIYQLTLPAPLPSGEYAMIVNSGQAQTATMMGAFGGRFYDFGVD